LPANGFFDLGYIRPPVHSQLPLTGSLPTSQFGAEVHQEISRLKTLLDEEKKSKLAISVENSKEIIELKNKVKDLGNFKICYEKEKVKRKSLEETVKNLGYEVARLKREKRKQESMKPKNEKEERLQRATEQKKETLFKIDSKKVTKQADEEWAEEYLDNTSRGVGVVAVKRKKSSSSYEEIKPKKATLLVGGGQAQTHSLLPSKKATKERDTVIANLKRGSEDSRSGKRGNMIIEKKHVSVLAFDKSSGKENKISENDKVEEGNKNKKEVESDNPIITRVYSDAGGVIEGTSRGRHQCFLLFFSQLLHLQVCLTSQVGRKTRSVRMTRLKRSTRTRRKLLVCLTWKVMVLSLLNWKVLVVVVSSLRRYLLFLHFLFLSIKLHPRVRCAFGNVSGLSGNPVIRKVIS
jgi:hypothetical protein